jgi:hypothetical protein
MQTRPTSWPSDRATQIQMSDLPTRDYPLAMVLREGANRSRRRRTWFNLVAALTLLLWLAIAIF